jgi:hypothetical protein
MSLDKPDGDFLLACFLTMFTFVFYFFGWKISITYFIFGFVFMFASIYYWVKVKKADQENYLY